MAFVARQGDPTTTGGVVISGSDTSFIEGQRVARVTDTVWCPMCQTVGFIIEGHDTWLDTRQPTAVDGSLVQCGCPTGTHRLVATQKSTLSEDQPPIPIHPEWLPLGVANSQRWAEAIQEGWPQNEFADSVPGEQARGMRFKGAEIVPELRPMLTDHQSVEPGFHIVQSPISRAALETLLFGQPDPAVLEKFRQLNSQLPERLRPGHLVVLSHPDNNLCTREESLLMEAAEKVSIELESLTDEETTFMLQYRSQVASILAYSGTATGVGTAAIGSHVNELKGTLQDIERLHQTFFQRDGHLRSAEFFSERRKLFTRLDSQLIGITKMSVAFPEHPKLKSALGISSSRLVHRWTQAGAAGQIPGYATHMEGISRASRVLKYGGWLGMVLSGEASYMKVQDVCTAGNKDACEKVKLTEAGSLTGGIAGGVITGPLLGTGVAGGICVAIGVPTMGVGAVACGLVVAGGIAYGLGTGGESAGAFLGELIYEAGK